MNASGKSASRAPPAAASPARPASLSIVAARSKVTGSACTHATLTGSSITRTLRGGETSHERLLALVVELKILRPAREHLAPVAVACRGYEPVDLRIDRVVPRRRRPVAELGLGGRHVDQERLRRRPRRVADRAPPFRTREQKLRPLVAHGRSDAPRNVEHRRRIRVAAVEDAR